ncbi:MAG: O-antigen ligase family protein [Magnetospirillum sp.]|nr:O-antigen ligase family protein [Magnetospirillum sp.]
MNRPAVADSVLIAAAAAMPLIAVLAPNGLAVLLAVAGALIALFDSQARRLTGVPRSILVIFAALLALALASCLWAPNPFEGLDGIARSATAGLAGLAVLSQALRLDSVQTERFKTALLGGFCIGLAIVLVEMVSRLMMQPRDSIFVRLFGEPAASDAFLNRPKTVLALLLPLALAIARRRIGPLAPAALAAGCAFAFVVGESMAAAFALAAALGGAVAFRFVGPRAIAAILVACVLAAPLATKLPTLDSLAERRDLTVSIYHRAAIWQFVGERISDKPVFGWGMHASRTMPGGHDKIDGQAEKIPLHPHNAPLQIWLELGGVGAALMAALLGFLAINCNGPPLRRTVLGATLVTAVVIASLSYGMWQGWWFATLWLLAAMAVAASPESLGRRSAS